MGKAHVDLRSVTTVGLDLAKHVFQIYAVGARWENRDRHRLATQGRIVFLSRSSAALRHRLLEACGSAHHWAREFGQTSGTTLG